MDTSIFTALFEQVIHNPGSLLIILAVSIVAYLLEMWPAFPNRAVWVICCVLGTVLYPLLTSIKTVSPQYPHPSIVLVLTGFVVGFVAAVVHVTLIRWVISKVSFNHNNNNNQGKDT